MKVQCTHCGGTGIDIGNDPCIVCRSTGLIEVIEFTRDTEGYLQFVRDYYLKNPCRHCTDEGCEEYHHMCDECIANLLDEFSDLEFNNFLDMCGG